MLLELIGKKRKIESVYHAGGGTRPEHEGSKSKWISERDSCIITNYYSLKKPIYQPGLSFSSEPVAFGRS
jgi:hypothetical protein